jgi:hypothetical protein
VCAETDPPVRRGAGPLGRAETGPPARAGPAGSRAGGGRVLSAIL